MIDLTFNRRMYLTREYLRYVKHLEIIAKRAKERELPKVEIEEKKEVEVLGHKLKEN